MFFLSSILSVSQRIFSRLRDTRPSESPPPRILEPFIPWISSSSSSVVCRECVPNFCPLPGSHHGRIEPSFALSLFLWEEQSRPWVDIPFPRGGQITLFAGERGKSVSIELVIMRLRVDSGEDLFARFDCNSDTRYYQLFCLGLNWVRGLLNDFFSLCCGRIIVFVFLVIFVRAQENEVFYQVEEEEVIEEKRQRSFKTSTFVQGGDNISRISDRLR